MSLDAGGMIPATMRRNHWMNQVLGHAIMKPAETAFKYLGETTNWSQAAQRMDAFAAALQRRGVKFGDRVLLLTLNRPEAIEAVFAINRLGAIAVPINIRLSPPEIAYIVDDADADVLIVDEPLVPLIGTLAQFTDRPQRIVVIGPAGTGQEAFADLAAEDTAGFQAPDVPEDSTCLIMYTSGTTGKPKGAMLNHINMYSQAVTCIRANDVFDESDISFLTAPLFHIAGLGSIAANFIIGIPTVIHPLGAFNPSELLDAWERENATIVFNVPQQWQAICAEPSVKDRNLKLRIISWGAAPASDSLLRAMADSFPQATNVAVFGQTELSPITCVLKGADSLRKLGSVGKPVPTLQYRIVDAAMNDVAPGEIGEILYRGPNLMSGYWRKPEATAEALEGGWFHSGDLVRQDPEGFVWVVDRKKDMIISGGENIYCAEVENVLFGHPKIIEVAIYGRADERWGEVPVAALALHPGEDISVAELQDWLSDKLARFKQPKDLVILDALPRNAAGKVNKLALRQGDAQSLTA
ncbi:long-chain-fatty-acid--CoA ligase [Psychromicrobium lacuslunae]|uniref:Long-chain fatty acid--CoA ligase n=1 Tax=Psychromicrobium lacuslunae TaxID=1618207 RepID=A0A0D4C256_9MICC|nr:long-chain-fatty-acid--CoA ligase [Psychromicrobium lacuslunae]AJT42456.1 long-chain fatty acid--CoA ligase [Psychromicrobium lacuslunae]